jgi:beta-lactam-binding protein with PASTA domain
VSRIPDAVVPLGEVISQTPSAGAQAVPGSTIQIVVSRGP